MTQYQQDHHELQVHKIEESLVVVGGLSQPDHFIGLVEIPMGIETDPEN